jgi:ADP-heptose:LPS heptosyltransferase
MSAKPTGVFLVNRLGDQLLALPAIRALGALFPQGLQLFLGEGMVSFVYRGVPVVGEPVRLWWDDYARETIDIDRVARAAAGCNRFICLSPPFSCAKELAARLGASRTIGHSEIFNDHIRPGTRSHQFDALFQIPQHIDPSLHLERFSSPPMLSAAAESAAARYVSTHCSFGQRLLFVHPETRHEKRWTIEGFAWVIERFLIEHPEYMVVVSSLEPFELGLHDRRVIRIAEHLELSFAVLKRAHLFLGVDSCFLHAADLWRIPGVVLFGPTSPARWGFRFSPNSCHVASASMDDIQPGSVLNALLEVAEKVQRSPLPEDGSGNRHDPLTLEIAVAADNLRQVVPGQH